MNPNSANSEVGESAYYENNFQLWRIDTKHNLLIYEHPGYKITLPYDPVTLIIRSYVLEDSGWGSAECDGLPGADTIVD